jgi:hypothetical protein
MEVYGAKYVFGRSGFGILVIVFIGSVDVVVIRMTCRMTGLTPRSKLGESGITNLTYWLRIKKVPLHLSCNCSLVICRCCTSLFFFKTRGFLSIPRLWSRLHQDSSPPTKVSQDKGFGTPCFQVHAKQNSTTLHLVSSLLRVSCPTRGKWAVSYCTL